MADAVYPKGKEAIAGAVDLSADTIKAALVTGAYNASHQYWSSLSSTLVGTAQTLTTKTLTNGKFTSDAVACGAVASGSTCNIVLYKDTGVAGTSPLVSFHDSGTNMPVVTNGGTVTYTPSAGNGWFTI